MRPLSPRTSRPVVCAALFVALALVAPTRAEAEPSWYKAKKTIEKEKKDESSAKQEEKAVIGTPAPGASGAEIANPFSELGGRDTRKIETSLLFKAEGLTQHFDLSYGSFALGPITGLAGGFQGGLGWWAAPRWILAFHVYGVARLQTTNIFLMAGGGIRGSFEIVKGATLSLFAAYGLSKGFLRTEASKIPDTSSLQAELNDRSGPMAGLQFSYLFWTRQIIGVGPTLAFMAGLQGERFTGWASLGISFQMRRPNYTGDLTAQ